MDSVAVTHWPRRDALQLLKLLAIQANHRIGREEAARLLWSDNEIRPVQRLNNAVYMLRKTLDRHRGESSLISTANGAIAFDAAASVWTDVGAFERLLDHAMPDPHCTHELEQAIALYKGHLLEAEKSPWCLYAQEQLRQRHLLALQALSQRVLQQGQPDQAIHWLRQLVNARPTDELHHRTLIELLVRLGRHQEARAQYEACRAALASELRTPSDPTRAALSQPPAAPAEAQDTTPAPRTPRRLRPPSPVQSLIGRQAVLQQLAHGVRAGQRAVTLSGPGGVGKTQLALHLAHMLESEFTDGACFVQLSDVLDAQAVPGILARAFGVEMDGNKNWEQGLADFLSGRHMLLVLDNFEHLLEAVPLVSWMLSTAPRLHIVCTSRSVLKFAGEHLFAVPPLDLPDLQCEDFTTLAGSPAVQLFAQRARALDASFTLTPENVTEVSAICHRLDGLPLAMELAAARLKLLGLRSLHERLQSSFDLLHRGRRDSPQRHRSLDTVLQWSYALLPAQTQRVFCALGMFAGGAALSDIQAVIDMPSTELADALDQLLEHSLLFIDQNKQTSACTERRLRMLQTVRDHALQQLARADPQAVQQRRFVLHWAAVAERIYKQRTSGQYRQSIAVFDDEFANFETAVHWSAQNDRALSHQFVATLAAFWGRRGFASEFFLWSRAHLDLHESHQDSKWYATACYATGLLSFAVGDYKTGRPYIEKAWQVSRESAQASQELLALGHLAVLSYVHGDVEQAMALNEQAIAFANRIGDTRSSANTVMNLGEMHLTVGNYAEAQACFDHGLTHKHLLTQSRPSILYFYFYLQARIRGNFTKARFDGQQSVSSGRDSRDPRTLGWMLTWHAEFHALMGELDSARALLNSAEQLNKRVGDAALQCLHGRVTGIYLLLTQEHASAIECLLRTLDESGQTGFVLDCDCVLLWLLRAYRMAGRPHEAQQTLQRLLSGQGLVHHYLIPGVLEEAAILFHQQKELTTARKALGMAVALRRLHQIAPTPSETTLSHPWLSLIPRTRTLDVARQVKLRDLRGHALIGYLRQQLSKQQTSFALDVT